MGVKTTVAALSYAANHVSTAATSGHDVLSTHREILLKVTELVIDLKRLVATMQGGDPNIATINAQITALS